MIKVLRPNEYQMKLDPIVVHLTDTDLYKFNMMQVFFLKHTDPLGEYVFKCRNEGIKWNKARVEEIAAQVDHLCTLKFTEWELEKLSKIRFLKRGFIEFLKLWRPLREYVRVSWDTETEELMIHVNGPIFSCMMFEIYLLEIVNEVYFSTFGETTSEWAKNYKAREEAGKIKLEEKIKGFKDGKYTFKFAEFGCRRRLSRKWEDYVIKRLKEEVPNMVGTSDVYMAFKHDLTPIGTYAHEYVQLYQGITDIPLAYGNKYAMQDWYDVYQGDNGTALTDTLGTDIFLLDFTRDKANNFTGVRHDSGDPYKWGEKMIACYEKFGIDPKTKTLLFSDSLDFDKAQALHDYFKDRINVSFGIGTFISNDTDVTPLNIVIKLQYVDGNPVAKLSDNPGKSMSQDEEYLKYLRNAVEFRLNREK